MLPPDRHTARHRSAAAIAAAVLAAAVVLPVRAQMPQDSLAVFLPPPSSWAAPDFTLPTQHDTAFSLAAQRGHVVLVNFWATWCVPCLREIPDLIRLHADLGIFGLRVVGVSVDEGGWAAVRPYADRLGIPYPLVLDDGRTGAAFGSSEMMPTTFVVDRRGRIRLVERGAFEPAQMRPILRALLAEGQPCAPCFRMDPAPML
jgi:peroxiredoxin